MVKIKRAYDPFESSDGFRILVDRLWPRGVTKEDAHVDHWLKEVAPSTELRKWFDHDPEKWKEFVIKYKKELTHSAALDELREMLNQHKKITLVYAAKDEEHCNAIVLQALLKK